jgi:O-antigen/teichoic acid export membrane protein
MPAETLQEQLKVDYSPASSRYFDPARQAFLNGCVNFAKGLLSVAITLALTPFLVTHLGTSGFGIWSLLGLFITYVGLIDLGISGAAAKFIGELSAGQDVDQISRVFTSAMALIGILACSAFLLAFLLRSNLEAGLATFGLFGSDAKIFLIGAAGIYSVGLISNGLQYVLLGLHRLDVANYIAASVLLVQMIGTVVVLRAGFGLPGLVGLIVVTSVLSSIGFFAAAKRLAPGLRFEWKKSSFATGKKLMSFGMFLQVYALVGVYYFYVGKAVVSVRFSLAAVAAYEVALRLPILFRGGILTVLGPLMPAVSRLNACGGTEEVKSLLVKAIRYSLLLGAPIFVGVAVFAGPIIRLWVGPGFSNSVLPLRILSIALGLSVFPDLVWYFLVGLGRQRLAVVFSLAVVIMGTLLTYVLAARWELAGVALGVLSTSLLGVVFYAALLVREGVLSLSDLPVSLGYKAIATASASYLIFFALARRFHGSDWNSLLAMSLASAVYVLSLVKGGVLENNERLFLRRFVPSSLEFLC